MNISRKSNSDGQVAVWATMQVSHEHDLADYEVYIWDINTDKEKDPVRITFHTGNDRWPDIHTGSVEKKRPEAPASAPQ